MKRFLALACFMALALAPLLLVTDAWARVGGGGSSGSRGSRSYSSPARPSQSPMSPSRPSTPPSSFQQPQRSGWGGALMGGLAGLALGGLLGSMLFGNGMGGGIGLLEILLIGGGIFLLFRMMRSRQAAPVPSYGQGYGGSQAQAHPQPQMYQAQAVDTGPSDLERSVSHIRQMDSGFDPARFGDTASDIFFRVQAAWMARDMSQASASLTPEMADILQKDCDRLRGQGRINRLENIAVRAVTVTEAWQESGQDYLTVHFLANLLDYTVDERSGQVVEGSRTEPVKFEEFWTFVRPVGPNAWRLSAIQQA
jgi:predicted lipid-binding transport protein (Tim44 family)